MAIRKLRTFAICVLCIGLLTLVVEWIKVTLVNDGLTRSGPDHAGLAHQVGRDRDRVFIRFNHSAGLNTSKISVDPQVSYDVHVFYYSWYGNPRFDNGSYYHWNHKYLPHWEKRDADKWPIGSHEPPEDIGANYYPLLGCYSSREVKVIHQHMQWLRDSKVGVLVFSWYPPNTADPNGHAWEHLVLITLDIAKKYNIKVTLHIEPYAGRTATSIRGDLAYIIKQYGHHESFYKHSFHGQYKPMIYMYDSYMISDRDWRSILSADGSQTIRGTELDVFVIALLVEQSDKARIKGNQFDGYYTYFASSGFTTGSKWEHWKYLATFAHKNDLIFIPSVGPGYVDEQVRPWNAENTKARKNGDYYTNAWTKAIESGADVISVTSFNEWHEGTQIEPAVAKLTKKGFRYLDYEPYGSMYYLKLTGKMVEQFRKENIR